MSDSSAAVQKSITISSPQARAPGEKFFEVSPTHCPHGVVALARMGVRIAFDGPVCLRYVGEREAIVKAGVLSEGQLPGNGYVNTKRFVNKLGQHMRVYRRGKAGVEVCIRLGELFEKREFEAELGFDQYGHCMNVAMEAILRAAGSREVTA